MSLILDANRGRGINWLEKAGNVRFVREIPVIVSATAPTFISAFTLAVKLMVTSIPSRLTELNPPSMNVTVYAPGGRLTT